MALRRNKNGKLMRPRGRPMTAEERQETIDEVISWAAAVQAMTGGETAAPTPIVYFVQGETGAGPIKIGTTTNIKSRLSALSVSSPVKLKLLAAIPGGTKVEADMHQRFRRHRLHGEWFSPAQELLDFIERASR
jgi:hypothetical protein